MSFLSVNQSKDFNMGTGTLAHVSHFGALKTSPTHPVVKGNFPGNTIDTDIWNEVIVGGATNTVGSGVASLVTTTANGDSIKLLSVNQGIFEAGQVTTYQSGVYAGDAVNGNIRIWGLMSDDELDGLFFRWNELNFEIVARKNGVETSVTSDNFNGEAGWVPTARNNTFRIFYSAGRAIFCRANQGNIKTLHTMIDPDFPLVDNLDLGLYYENTNIAPTSVSVELRVRGASSSLFGELPTSRADGNISDSTILELTKSVLTGRDGMGEYRNVATNTGGALLTSNFLEEVTLGVVPNFQSLVKFGITPLINIGSAPHDVWQGSGLYTGQPVPVVSDTVNIVSTNVNDTAAGTGARTIRIDGLDSNFDEISEVITLNGTTPVISVNQYVRLFRAVVLTAGSSGENLGAITAAHTTVPANIFFSITPSYNQTQVAAYTIPNGKTGLIVSFDYSCVRSNGSQGSIELRLLQRPEGGVYNAIRVLEVQTSALSNTNLNIPIVVSERSDLLLRVTDISDNATFVSGSFGILLKNN